MTTSTIRAFAILATTDQIERTASALGAHGFIVEILDDVAAARTRISELLPPSRALLVRQAICF
jgi:hypothetical protein